MNNLAVESMFVESLIITFHVYRVYDFQSKFEPFHHNHVLPLFY